MYISLFRKRCQYLHGGGRHAGIDGKRRVMLCLMPKLLQSYCNLIGVSTLCFHENRGLKRFETIHVVPI